MPRMRSALTAGVLFVTGLVLTAMACASLLEPVPTRAPAVALPTALSTKASIPLYQQVKLSTSPLEEQGQLFGYKVTAQTPVLVGSSDASVKVFNAEMKTIVDQAVADFKQKLSDLPATPDSQASTFDLRYNLLSPPGDILSLKFDIRTYYTGAAHPSTVSRTVTFDLQQGKDVGLSELFIPGADFLTPISKFCINQLSKRDIGFADFELGATATLENYRNWNITADGLMITFDEYQVAPYAAGPQTVVIPYNQLAQLIRPDGPLGPYLQ